jgi:NAD(P)H-hydrate epimerase
MHELLTTEEMARADAATIKAGTPGFDLMLAAGQAVAMHVQQNWPVASVLVLCGPGNNGGDGYVAAKLLQEAGWQVTVQSFGDPTKLTGDAAKARDYWDGEIMPLSGEALSAQPSVVIDALFGAGLARPLEGALAKFVQHLNQQAVPVVAVDVPTGIDGTTGQAQGIAVEAHSTVTFFRKKPGHLLYPGRQLCGALHVSQIGIKTDVLPKLNIKCFENHPSLWRSHYPWPDEQAHKFHRGSAFVFSGGPSTSGAARLTARAALRAGAGLVTLCCPGAAMHVNACHLTEVMLKRADDPESITSALEDTRISAVAIGPGAGVSEETQAKVLTLLGGHCPAVLDADALSSFAVTPDTLFNALRPTDILTPHEGEFERLFPGLLAKSESRLEAAREAAQHAGAIIVLKGPDTVIAAPNGRAAINANGTAWLATAGSGDVLAGIVTGLAAQGMPSFEAACAGVWLHGATGQTVGPGLIAGDLIEALPTVLGQLLQSTG